MKAQKFPGKWTIAYRLREDRDDERVMLIEQVKKMNAVVASLGDGYLLKFKNYVGSVEEPMRWGDDRTASLLLERTEKYRRSPLRSVMTLCVLGPSDEEAHAAASALWEVIAPYAIAMPPPQESDAEWRPPKGERGV